jgi:hypothetical protein
MIPSGGHQFRLMIELIADNSIAKFTVSLVEQNMLMPDKVNIF